MPQEFSPEDIRKLVETPEYQAQRQALSPVRVIGVRSVGDRQADIEEEAAAAGLSPADLIQAKAALVLQERQQQAEQPPKAKRQTKKLTEAEPTEP